MPGHLYSWKAEALPSINGLQQRYNDIQLESKKHQKTVSPWLEMGLSLPYHLYGALETRFSMYSQSCDAFEPSSSSIRRSLNHCTA